jgi:lipoprotein signal peptidase
MTATRPMLVCVVVGFAVVVADFGSKAAITTSQPLRRLPFVLPVQNPGYFLGAGSGLAPGLVSLALLLLVGWRLIAKLQMGAASALGVGLVLGGCLANVSERLVRGAVTDFIRMPWIVLDAADLAVLTGLVLLAVERLSRLLHPQTSTQDTSTPAC